jgi:Xaa-Pro aminopeptidase
MEAYRHRRLQVRSLLRRYKCSCLLISDPIDVEYLSGFRASRAFILVTPGAFRLFTDFRYQEEVSSFCRAYRGWSYCIIKGEDYTFLTRFAGRYPTLAFQSDVVTVDQFTKIKKALPSSRLVPLASVISGLFSVKDSMESAHLARAAAAGDRALDAWRKNIRPGITERAAASALDRACAEAGSEKAAFDTIVLFGARAALPHGRPGGTRLRRGDFVLVDFGCTIAGWCSDMTRTFVCGKASPRQRAIYEIVARAQTAARAAARAGMAARELDRTAREIIEQAGYGHAFGHSLGHGVGRRVHESPRIASRSKEVVKKGNVITIEPGIYLPGFGGVRIEDTVLITGKGNRSLTKFPRELMEL